MKDYPCDSRHTRDITINKNTHCPEMHFKGNLIINLDLELMPSVYQKQRGD